MSKQNKSDNFSDSFDQLFESPPKFSFDRKNERLIIIGILMLAAIILVPLLLTIPLFIEEFGSNDDDTNYIETSIYQDNLYLDNHFDFKDTEKYSMSLENNSLVFNDTYFIDLGEYEEFENYFDEVDFQAKEGSDKVKNILIIHKTRPIYHTGTLFNPNETIFLDDNQEMVFFRTVENLLARVEYRSRNQGSFLKLYVLEPIGPVKTGLIVDYKALSKEEFENNPTSNTIGYLDLNKYWLFPDGAGVIVEADTFAITEGFEVSSEDLANQAVLFQKVDDATQNALTWFNESFQMEVKAAT